MTLYDLEQTVHRGDEPLLTLKQVAEITDTPYNTVRTWVYQKKWLPTVPVGPGLVPRVRGSVIVKLFCYPRPAPRGQCIRLLSTS